MNPFIYVNLKLRDYPAAHVNSMLNHPETY